MTRDELRAALEALPPGTSLTLPREALLEVLGTPPAAKAQPAAPDEWLSADAVAQRLDVTRRWVYDHTRELGGRRLTRRCVRFSAAAVRRYLERVRR